MAEEKFYFDSLQDCQSITDFLQSLTEGFGKGELTLRSNGDAITMCPRGLLGFTVKAKRKRGASKLDIRITWKDRDDDETCDTMPLRVE